MSIEFDEESHTYKIDGRRAPGIHEVLGLGGILGYMPDDTSRMEFGKRVHTGVEHDIIGELYKPDYTDEELGCIYAARKARKELKLILPHVELLVYNRELWYATKVDAVGSYEGDLVVINWKTGGNWPWYTLQSAAEALCFSLPYRRLTIFLDTDGDFDPVEHKDKRDFRTWRSVCDVVNWKFRHGDAPLKPGPDDDEAESLTFPEADSPLFDKREQPEKSEGLFG